MTCDGETTGVVAPRWLCHLMGLCHRTVHLVLRTPQDWLALQVRGRHVDWPGRLDLSVTGHVRAGLSWQQAMQREAAEELGLDLAPEVDDHRSRLHACRPTLSAAARPTASIRRSTSATSPRSSAPR